jgi:HD-like signal output (HDOD) protein
MPVAAEDLERFLNDVQLPPLPEVVPPLIQVAGDPSSSASDVAAIMNADPILTARLLKAANSSFFGQLRKVTTVERATVILGLNYVKAIALAVQLTVPFSKLRAKGMDMEAFWCNSLLRACVARQIAMRARLQVAGQAFVIGLTQDLAIPALAVRQGPDYSTEYDRLQAVQHELAEWELQTLGFTHAELAEAILDSWNLPPVLTRPIGAHHDRPATDEATSADETLNSLRAVARLTGMLPLGATVSLSDKRVYLEALESIQGNLGIDAAAIGDILRFAQNEFQSIRGLFGEVLPEKLDVGEIIAKACERLAEVDPRLFAAAFS